MTTYAGTPEQIADEIKKLIETRHTLYGYVKHVIIEAREGWLEGEHIRIMCDKITSFLNDPDKRGLMVSMPPRHMKSVTISNALPIWYISNNPQKEVIMASYALSLARDNLRAARALLDEPLHKRVWPNQELQVDATDSLQFIGKANGRPNIVASGTLGGITGKGADLFIIDDPVKDALQADSQTYRTRLYEWFKMVAVSRLSPGGKIILVSTRWHHEDLQGQILRDNPEGWDVLNFPAISDDGRALWPERYDITRLEQIRRELGSRAFEAQYQGRPHAAEGGFFKLSWLRTGPPMSEKANRVRYWDKAATHDGGDYTVGVLMASEHGQYCIEDVVRLQGSPKEVQDTVQRTAEKDGVKVRIMLEQEPGSSGVDIIDHWARNILRGYSFRGEKVTGSKEVRADPMASAWENGNLWMVEARWNRDYRDELAQFPLGAHDDQVDASSGAFRALSQMGREMVIRWV